MKLSLEEALADATPLPWPIDWREPDNPNGTTCHESNANDRLKRHCVNNLSRLLAAVKAERDAAMRCEEPGTAEYFKLTKTQNKLNAAIEAAGEVET